MAAETTDRVIEGKEYRQHMLDKISVETSEAETFFPDNSNDKEKIVRMLENKIDTLKSIIDDMTEKSRDLEDNARAEYEKNKKILEQHYNEAVLRLNQMRDASDDAWKDLQDGTVKAWKELADSVKNAISRLR